MSRHPDDHHIQCPDDIDPYDHGRFNRASDEWMDAHPDRETEADRQKWAMTSEQFVTRWRHLLFGEGALSRKQAGG
jgi:hypothetical protein